MPVAQWDVVVLPFPYSDRLAEKRRPALVISSNDLHRDHGLLWVVMITSDRGVSKPGDVPITNLREAGLPAPSLVRPAKIAAIEPGRVLRKLGVLSPGLRRRVGAQIEAYL